MLEFASGWPVLEELDIRIPTHGNTRIVLPTNMAQRFPVLRTLYLPICTVSSDLMQMRSLGKLIATLHLGSPDFIPEQLLTQILPKLPSLQHLELIGAAGTVTNFKIFWDSFELFRSRPGELKRIEYTPSPIGRLALAQLEQISLVAAIFTGNAVNEFKMLVSSTTASEITMIPLCLMGSQSTDFLVSAIPRNGIPSASGYQCLISPAVISRVAQIELSGLALNALLTIPSAVMSLPHLRTLHVECAQYLFAVPKPPSATPPLIQTPSNYQMTRSHAQQLYMQARIMQESAYPSSAYLLPAAPVLRLEQLEERSRQRACVLERWFVHLLPGLIRGYDRALDTITIRLPSWTGFEVAVEQFDILFADLALNRAVVREPDGVLYEDPYTVLPRAAASQT
ncbi:hypothetical protein BKA62DRAFT_762934 [Auriculariales sp. MPI-PUGE-AT-0066]|nr:hypothetical protein BKA62DRAFT_762934 [Auriculariales sp. MPI-PUGE-AT-0066]